MWELVLPNFPLPDFAETQKKYRWNFTISPRSIPEQAKSSSKGIMAPKFLLIDPSLRGGTGDGGTLGAVACATLVRKRKENKALGRALPLQPSWVFG
jgi:hypothetical protein